MTDRETKTKIKSYDERKKVEEKQESGRSRGQGQGLGQGGVGDGDRNKKGNKITPVIVVDLSEQMEARTFGDSSSTYVAMEIDEDPITPPPLFSLSSRVGKTFLTTEEGSMNKNLPCKRSSGVENTVDFNKEEVENENDGKNENFTSNMSKSSDITQNKKILNKNHNKNLVQGPSDGKNNLRLNQPENIPQVRQPGNVPDVSASGSPANRKESIKEKEKYKERRYKEKGKEIMNDKENKNEMDEKIIKRKDVEFQDKNSKIMKDYKREYENIKKTKIENQEKEKLFHAESFRREGENLDLQIPYLFQRFPHLIEEMIFFSL